MKDHKSVVQVGYIPSPLRRAFRIDGQLKIAQPAGVQEREHNPWRIFMIFSYAGLFILFFLAYTTILYDPATNNRQTSLLKQSPNTTPPLSKPPTLILLGERHSGTKWMTQHLEECFGNSTTVTNHLQRWKHWFQDDGQYKWENAVVVAQFRNSYDWVEAMRVYPHHAPNHFNLKWQEFVSRPWTMPRRGKDLALYREATNTTPPIWPDVKCLSKFRLNEMVPCVESIIDRSVHTLYELRRDGSGLPYDSILDLRRDKIRNFLDIGDFERVQDLYAVRYEDMKEHGTESLIRSLEETLGIEAQCEPVEGRPLSHRPLSKEYVEWMRENVDWETEALLGYGPDGVV